MFGEPNPSVTVAFGFLTGVVWSHPLPAKPPLSSLTALVPNTCVTIALNWLLLLLVSTVAAGVDVALPAAYGMNSRQLVPRIERRVRGENCTSMRTPVSRCQRVPVRSMLNARYGVVQVDVRGSCSYS